MTKRPLSDLTRALDIVDLLEDAMEQHSKLIAALLDRVEALEKRLETLSPNQ